MRGGHDFPKPASNSNHSLKEYPPPLRVKLGWMGSRILQNRRGYFFIPRPENRFLAYPILIGLARKKWGLSKSGIPKWTPFEEAIMAKTQGKQRVLALFRLKKGSIFGSISGPPFFRIQLKLMGFWRKFRNAQELLEFHFSAEAENLAKPKGDFFYYGVFLFF